MISPEKVVESLIKNNYVRVNVIKELGIDYDYFQSKEFVDYVTQTTYSVELNEVLQLILRSLNELDVDSKSYHRDKQKYIDQLIHISTINKHKIVVGDVDIEI